MPRIDNDLYIDTSDTARLCKTMKAVMNEAEYKKALNRIVKNTAKDVRKFVTEDVRKQYAVREKDIKAAFCPPKYSETTGELNCVIPIRGARGKISKNSKGMFVKATGGAKGWAIRPYKVGTKIVVGHNTVLPNQTKHPTFINTSTKGKAPKLNTLAFARESSERLPIRPVVGIAIPQMPVNRAAKDVENDIADRMFREAEHQFMWYMGLIKKN